VCKLQYHSINRNLTGRITRSENVFPFTIHISLSKCLIVRKIVHQSHIVTKLLQTNYIQNNVQQNELKKAEPPNGEHKDDCPQHTRVVSQDRTSTQVTRHGLADTTRDSSTARRTVPSQLGNDSLTDSPVRLQQFGGP